MDRIRLYNIGFWVGFAGTFGLWYVICQQRAANKLLAEGIETIENTIDIFNDRPTSLRYKLDPTKPGYND